MKRYLLFLIATALLTVPVSCIDDDSSFATGNIHTVEIAPNTTSDTIRLGYQDTLRISPTISQGSQTDNLALTYSWQIADQPGSEPDDYTELGTSKDLNAVITNSVSNSPYKLKLVVTDTVNSNLQYTYLWDVYVQGSFLDGIVVASTHDGKTSDFSLIMDKNISVNYERADKVYHHVMENANGSPCQHLMKQLTHTVFSGSFDSPQAERQIWAVDDQGILYRYDASDFSLDGTSEEGTDVLTYTGSHPNFQFTFNGGSLFFAVSDDNTYLLYSPTSSTFGWYSAIVSAYRIPQNGVAAHVENGSYKVFWYDPDKGCIVAMAYTMSTTPSLDDALEGSDDTFYPDQLSGYTAIAAGFTSEKDAPSFLLRNNSTGTYSIFTLTGYQSSVWNDDWTEEISPEMPPQAESKIDLPSAAASLIDKAVSVFFANDQKILYVATADGVYAINFANGEATLYDQPKFTPPAGEEIIQAKVFVQGAYAAVTTNWPERSQLPYNYHALMIATTNGSNEGSLTLVPDTQIGTGNLDVSKQQVWTGFGKILDICTVGY